MEDVVKATSRSSDLLEEISLASGEQSKGVSQIGVAVTQMEKTTQQNAVLLEKSATATESLREQAVQLVSAVSVFRVSPAPRVGIARITGRIIRPCLPRFLRRVCVVVSRRIQKIITSYPAHRVYRFIT